ncbi:MAG: hypothetical protein OXI60_02570 [Acidiferrobacterales bacterium]|nr:hypothetical protein [Acidiferrobacterales bacterium]
MRSGDHHPVVPEEFDTFGVQVFISNDIKALTEMFKSGQDMRVRIELPHVGADSIVMQTIETKSYSGFISYAVSEDVRFLIIFLVLQSVSLD